MTFTETALAGVFVISPDRLDDERGFFARTFCHDEFARQGLSTAIRQTSISYNRKRGTLRGLHFQAAPHAECKLVRCTTGAIFDVAVDLRPASKTARQWIATELSATNRLAVYVPPGVAHGFQTLVDDVEVLYYMSETYRPELARGIRWDDPTLAITWPVAATTISERDRTLPLLSSILEEP